jgi:hypothetical protein
VPKRTVNVRKVGVRWRPLLFFARISGADDSPDRAIQGSLGLNDVMNEKLAP